MKVRFLKDHTTKESAPQSFKKGEEVDFYELHGDDTAAGTASEGDAERQRRVRAQASADHFVKRGIAEAVEEGARAERARRGRTPPREEPEAKGDAAKGEGEAPKAPPAKPPGPQPAAPPARGPAR